MNKRGSITAAFLAFGLLYHQAAPGSEKPAKDSLSSALVTVKMEATAPQHQDGPWAPFCEHEGIELKAAAGETDSEKLQPWISCKPASPIKFILATVPDPEQTHLSLDFDRYVESIAWAVSDSSYVLENYWFPWQTRSEKQESDPQKREAISRDREHRLQMPGVLLFHKNVGGAQEVLAVFLIGERPTFGVSNSALNIAIDAVETMKPSETKISLVGPSFSGSLPALKRFIDNLNCRGNPKARSRATSFTIVSGQTTSTAELNAFGSPGSISLNTTVNDDNFAVHRLLEFLPPQDVKSQPDMALLSEDETAYGNSLKQTDFPDRILMVRYPRGIARLRNASNEVPGTGAATDSTPHNVIGDLPLVLKETGEDVISSFSTQQTPFSSEALLVSVAGMLRRNRIHYAGVLATDPLDALFLTRFLHTACPDIQLIVFSSDLLFARVAHNWSIEGLLTVTTYPLFMESQDLMEPKVPPRRIPFASAYAEGVYNATRAALEQSSSGKFGVETLFDYLSPVTKAPPLWLTILGHDGFWPVALLDGEQPFSKPVKQVLLGNTVGARHLPEKPSLFWQILFTLSSLYSAVVISIVLVMNRPRGQTVKRWLRAVALTRNFALLPGAEVKAAQATNIFIILGTVAITNALFVLTLLPLHDLNVFLATSLSLIACALAESIWMTCIVIRQRPSWDVWILFVFSWVFVVLCFATLTYTWSNRPEIHMMEFFAYRALHPESGTSPILPALILAQGYNYWAFIQLRRLRWIKERQPSLPLFPCACVGSAKDKTHVGDTSIHKRSWFVETPFLLSNEIDSIFGSRTSVLSIPFSVAWLWIFWPPSYVTSVEPLIYRFFFASLLVVMYGMLIGNWIRFMFLWKDFSQMLAALESHPLRTAFSRLPDDFSWVFIWMGSLQPQMTTFTRSFDCLRKLLSKGEKLLPDGQLHTLERSLNRIAEEQRLGTNRYGSRFFRSYRSIEYLYSCAAYEAAIRLEKFWSEGSADSITEHNEKVLSPLTDEELKRWPLEEFLALRYVAFIRYVLQQMRNFLAFVTTAFILLAIATVAYPFQGHHSIATAHLVLFAILGSGVFIAFLRMDRDPLLSRLNGSNPNEVGFGFIWRILSYGSIPLISLLGSQFPSVREFLFSWVQPALEAIK